MTRAILFGPELRRLRHDAGFTLEILGRKLRRRRKNVSKAYLSSIENAKCNPPRYPLVREIARVLNTPADRLILLACLDKLPEEVNALKPIQELREKALSPPPAAPPTPDAPPP